MRFTTWSTLTNAFIISTVALLSLIQAANGSNAFAELYILTPNGQDPPPTPGGPTTIRWAVFNKTELPMELQATETVFIHLRDLNDSYYNYKFEPLTIYDKNYTSVGYASEVTFPLPGDISVGPFYIQFVTWYGSFNGSQFTIEY